MIHMIQIYSLILGGALALGGRLGLNLSKKSIQLTVIVMAPNASSTLPFRI